MTPGIVVNRILLLILFTIFYSLSSASAQSGLNVTPLFEGKIIPQERMVETRVRGKALSKYQLTFFRSVRFVATDKEVRQVRQLVEKDCSGVGEHNFQSQKSRQQETLLIQLPGEGGQNRFLCYKNWEKGRVTVVYMEGRLSSFETLKEILK